MDDREGVRIRRAIVTLAIAAAAGGRLIIEKRQRTLGPIPLSHAGHVNGKCPRCRCDQFYYQYGDMLCLCAGCGAELDVDELAP